MNDPVRKLLAEMEAERPPMTEEEARALLRFGGWCVECGLHLALPDSDRCGECEPGVKGALL